MAKTIVIKQDHSSSTNKSIRVLNYMNSAVKTFSRADNVRSIPGLDGLKPAQRKAIYGTFLKGEKSGPHIVARLAASIAESTDYHHGTGSMESTLVKLAVRKIPGENNMPLFIDEGQYGSRLTPDAGAGRYIETALSVHFRELFKKDDDVILEHALVDGEKIEPKLYLPILPFVLVNGAQGIGTGHSTKIKSYHPDQVRDACLRVLKGEKLTPYALVPWFNGFKGTVSRNETNQVVTKGTLQIVNTTTLRITELPIGNFLDDYKALLSEFEEPKRNKEGEVVEPALVRDFDDASTEESFDFTVTVPRTTTALGEEVLYQKFKLIDRDSENFTLWNEKGNLQRFESAEDVIHMYVPWRLSFYEVRRQKLIADISENVRALSETIRFIQFYLERTEVFSNSSKKELINMLLENEFTDYDRLLSMAIWNLTRDRIEELLKKLDDAKASLAILEADSAVAMYTRELKAFKFTPLK